MTQRQVAQWLRENRWFVAAVIVVFGGYSLGKDLALRDNAVDRARTQAVGAP